MTVNQDTLKNEIQNASDNVTVVIPTDKDIKTAEAVIVVKNVDDMAEKEITLTIQTGNVQYDIPPASIDTAAIMEALGATDTANVQISIVITAHETTPTYVQAAADKSGLVLVIPPVQFTITAEYNGKTAEVTTFDQYVERTIEVTAEQAANITTAVIIEPDGTTRHIPTYVYQKNGKWYVVVNSLTNSTYALVHNERSFTDTAGKWYEAYVSEMANRMIMDDIGGSVFAGDRDITRAEFVAIVIRALGLPDNGSRSVFSDVPANMWYAGAVGKAYEYGLVSGVGGGRFDPDTPITRQEAMTAVRRAAQIAGFEGSAGNSIFPDTETVSEWALDAVLWNIGSGLVGGTDGSLNPHVNITRAETAVLVLKLLRKAGLVDDRTPISNGAPRASHHTWRVEPRKEPEAVVEEDSTP